MSDQISDFAAELENFLDFETPQMGDIRTGTVVSISPQGAIVALSNLKRDGIVPNSDLNRLEPGEREALSVDDEVAVRIINTNDPDSLIVSIYQARIVEDWDNAEKLKESGDLIEVEISGYNKGGLIAPFGRLRGFIPLSQVTGFSRNMNDRDRQRKMAKMRGTGIPVKVIEVDRQRRRLVFSQREGQREWDAARKEEFLKTVNVGDKIKGTVRSIRDFGVFVDLGEADGLVHVSELEWYRVRHPREVVKVGDEIEVQVLKVDRVNQKISLSRKPLIENPWDRIHEKYDEGQLVEGIIVRITDYGAFVELEPGVEGLLHITQLSRANVENTEEIVQEGERHLLRVLTVDSDRQRIRLSLKAVSATEQIEWMTRQNQAAAEAADQDAADSDNEFAAEESAEEDAVDEVAAEDEAVAEATVEEDASTDVVEAAEESAEENAVDEAAAEEEAVAEDVGSDDDSAEADDDSAETA